MLMYEMKRFLHFSYPFREIFDHIKPINNYECFLIAAQLIRNFGHSVFHGFCFGVSHGCHETKTGELIQKG